ncbi:hypothetical protein J7I01_002741 [Vibrio parahaemolyticus]|nr:hypothetical protein [Vibrio parahaemolyticus]
MGFNDEDREKCNMFKYIKSQLLKSLGGIPVSEHRKELEHAKSIAEERDMYKDLAKSIYIYTGNYPAWKAQSEYRHCMEEWGHTISKEFSKPHPTRPELVDQYLGKIVDGFAMLYEKNPPDFMQSPSVFWEKDKLSEARGDNFLK